jgi:hypothetical protein
MKRLGTAWEKRQRLERVCTEITGEPAEEWPDDENAPPEVRLRSLLNRRDQAVRQGQEPSGKDAALLGILIDQMRGVEGVIKSLTAKRRQRKRKP